MSRPRDSGHATWSPQGFRAALTLIGFRLSERANRLKPARDRHGLAGGGGRLKKTPPTGQGKTTVRTRRGSAKAACRRVRWRLRRL